MAPSNGSTQCWALVVEDDAVTRAWITKLAGRERYAVHEAASVLTALDLLRRRSYDLILIDSHLPDGLGSDIVRFIRSSEHHAQVPVVAISSDGRGDSALSLMQAGADRLLCKPIPIGEIRKLMRSYCPPTVAPTA